MEDKLQKKVLIVTDWFLPGYKAGGPIQSINNLLAKLGKEYQFTILTSNKDLGDTLPYPNIEYNRILDKGRYRIMYLDEAHQNYSFYRSILNNESFDLVYLNSLFSFKFSILPLRAALRANVKVILAPRGMLGKGALKIKPLKKQVFLKGFKMLGWHKKIVWHATAVSEQQEIFRNFGNGIRCKIASNLPQRSLDYAPRAKEKGDLKLFYLSRIHPKKNLLGALRLLKGIDSRTFVEYTIIGPVDDPAYWKECQEEIKKMPSNIKVEYVGAVPHANLQNVLNNQHALLLPTFNENYGHVIVESWQNGCLTIISDQTPWRDLNTTEIGWDIPLDSIGEFKRVIEYCAQMSQEDFDKKSKKAFMFAKDYFDNPKILNANRELFNK
ncbi:glycosyltransferase [Mangrovimonas sp. YM274]|uniref:glycosyltransferase n=1 Tax=Mangrovimonas sp. YM274 TaxID=3070660 RepID=UPI0027DCD006|nr:glycosyltransferase [Mangrovimonas sp. YM274]WMI68439.1 glycosyltransferase [Mangrovimonas sp. YM274]